MHTINDIKYKKKRFTRLIYENLHNSQLSRLHWICDFHVTYIFLLLSSPVDKAKKPTLPSSFYIYMNIFKRTSEYIFSSMLWKYEVFFKYNKVAWNASYCSHARNGKWSTCDKKYEQYVVEETTRCRFIKIFTNKYSTRTHL